MARVLLVFGGRSAEHEISCISAVAILEALTGAGHEVVPVGIDRSGGWHLAEGSSDPLVAAGPAVSFSIPEGTISGAAEPVSFDVIFPVLHGPYGEDGTIQGMFDMAGVRYVGCGVLGSAAAMDKDVAKRLFLHAGLPTADYRVIRSVAVAEAAAADEIGYPLFVKPASMGSSLGVSRVDEAAHLPAALEAAFAFSDKVILEENIPGREIEVAVLEGPRTSLPGEIVLAGEWYDFDAKYTDDTSEFVAPADLTSSQSDEVRAMAAMAFEVLECVGLARVDFRYEEGRGFLINEVNTMPGFTPISGFPKMWIASGMTYAELCDELVQLALA